jgi:hypothetical protein
MDSEIVGVATVTRDRRRAAASESTLAHSRAESPSPRQSGASDRPQSATELLLESCGISPGFLSRFYCPKRNR